MNTRDVAVATPESGQTFYVVLGHLHARKKWEHFRGGRSGWMNEEDY